MIVICDKSRVGKINENYRHNSILLTRLFKVVEKISKKNKFEQYKWNK